MIEGAAVAGVGERFTRRKAVHGIAATIGAGATAGAAIALASCGPGGGGAQAPATGKQLGPQHLRIWWPFGSENLAVKESWQEFQTSHPDWTAEIIFNGSYDKFLTGVAAGDVPDVYMPSSEFVLEGAAKGYLRPLDQLIARDKIDWSAYYKAAQIGCEYKKQCYGMPHHVDVYSVYANDKVLREAGMDPSKKPASWDELLTSNQRLRKGEVGAEPARLGFIPTFGLGAFPLFYFPANGVSMVSDDGSTVGFDTPAGLEALEWMAQAVKTLGGWELITAFQRQFEGGVGTALGRDGVGYGHSGVWIIEYNILKANPQAEIGQWNFPGGPSARGKEFGHFIADYDVIPTESKRHDAAWRYIVHDTSAAGQKYVQSAPGAWDIATLPNVANDPEAIKKQPWRKRANELMATATSPSYFPHPGSREINGQISKVVQPLLQGNEGAKATMENLKREVQLLMDQYRPT
jgi:ABC-type glycerol-3-phosphate transport system substrate-binding protein